MFCSTSVSIHGDFDLEMSIRLRSAVDGKSSELPLGTGDPEGCAE